METITPEQMRTKIESDIKLRKFTTRKPLDISNNILQKIKIFGKYNGKAVKWDVIDVKENKALVITEDIEVPDLVRTESSIKDWSDSEIRKWLNGTFFNTAFSALEQAQILTTKVETCCEDNPESKVETEDKIFLLSSSEKKYYKEDLNQKQKLRVALLGLSEIPENTLLRDSCGHQGKIRPAMWINLNGIDKVLGDREKRNKPIQERLKFFGCDNNEKDVPIPQTWEVIDVSENIATIFPLSDYVDKVRKGIHISQQELAKREPGFLGGCLFCPSTILRIEFSKEESEKVVFKKEEGNGYIQIKIDADLGKIVEARVKESERFKAYEEKVTMQEKSKEKKGRTLTPEEIKEKLEAEKRRRELAYRLKESEEQNIK